jgi:hypothetical protein
MRNENPMSRLPWFLLEAVRIAFPLRCYAIRAGNILVTTYLSGGLVYSGMTRDMETYLPNAALIALPSRYQLAGANEVSRLNIQLVDKLRFHPGLQMLQPSARGLCDDSSSYK